MNLCKHFYFLTLKLNTSSGILLTISLLGKSKYGLKENGDFCQWLFDNLSLLWMQLLKKNPANQKTDNKPNSWEEIVSDFCLQSCETIAEDFG